MEDYIKTYLNQLESSMNERVSSQFTQAKSSIDAIDNFLAKIEAELEY